MRRPLSITVIATLLLATAFMLPAAPQISAATDPGTIAYVRGIGGLVARDYDGAAQWFAQAERERLALPTIRPLEVYALCLAGRLDDARRLAEDVNVHDADARHFWNWLASTFQVRAQPTQ